jgi:RNA polymerase sigma factor (sigma-70 family)
MAEDDQQFADLLRQVAAGSEDAARQLIDRHRNRIYQVIRRRLNKELRSKFDSHDFFQAVWASFFADRELIGTFRRPEKLVAYLGAVAANKVVEENRRRFTTRKHDISRERRIDNSRVLDGEPIAAKLPTPSEVAIAKEQMDRLIEGQPAQYRRIVELRADGLTYEEIGREVGMAERSVRRVMKKLLLQLAQ